MDSRSQVFLPTLPEKPICLTSTLQVYIIPTEERLFLQGFDAHEYAERPPTLLRGCLWVKVLKPTRIKSISLQFKGVEKTDWPEGIPPKRNQTVEVNDIVSHTWPFYQLSNTVPTPNNGADFYKELYRAENDVSSLNLADSISRGSSPAPEPTSIGFLNANLSPARLVKRATSTIDAGTSFTSLTDLSPISSVNDDSSKLGSFAPGDYIYNFEHPVRLLLPETTSVTFGSVFYHLEVSVARYGTFKPTLTGRIPLEIVRIPSEENLEENEPIVITRTWDDQLRYDIVVGAKSVILNSYLPLAFRFVPLFGKVTLHRIRVYFTEHLEYYCQNKKVHRMEPQKKYLLLEHKAQKGHSLLADGAIDGDDDVEILPKELEFQVYVPEVLNRYHNHMLHPDTSFANIRSHHWIKICLRLSRNDPGSEKRKHYEISIDSPIHVLSPQAAHGNTLLPAYEDEQDLDNSQVMSSPPLSPGVTPLDFNNDLDSIGRGLNIPIERTGSPYRVNSPMSEGEPIERDSDMHLEANLYEPTADSIDAKLIASQAHPDTTVLPLNSPMQRPIHVLRRPSFNPPTFEVATSPQLSGAPIVEAGPPPAYEDSQSLSMSPLRIGDGVPESLFVAPIAGLAIANPSSTSETPIKEMLRLHLGSNYQLPAGSDHDARSHSSRDTQSSGSSLKNSHNGASARNSLSSVANLKAESLPTSHNEDGNMSANKSRKSSVSSVGSAVLDHPMDQTLPLLGASTTSVDAASASRNSSIASFPERRPSTVLGAQRIVDFMSDSFADDLYKSGNLSLLRNPRLKKHYQDELTVPQPYDKSRQKSFGIVDALNGGDTSSRSSTSTESVPNGGVGETGLEANRIDKAKEVPGLNVDYIM